MEWISGPIKIHVWYFTFYTLCKWMLDYWNHGHEQEASECKSYVVLSIIQYFYHSLSSWIADTLFLHKYFMYMYRPGRN